MSAQSAVGLRHLGSRALLLGTGDGDALENIDTTILPDGAFCWVEDQTAYYALHKDSAVAVAPPLIIAPESGPGRWFQIQTGGGGIGTWAAVLATGNLSGGHDPTLTSGDTLRGQNTAGVGGAIALVAGTGGAGFAGGAITLTAASSAGGDANGGSIVLVPGTKTGAGTDGVVALVGPVSTAGSPLQLSPGWQLFGSVFSGGTAHATSWLMQVVPIGLDDSILSFYHISNAGTELSMTLESDGVGNDPILSIGATGLGGLHVAAVQSPGSLSLLTGGGQLAIRLDDPPGGPGHDNETSIQTLRLLDSTGSFAAKLVSQGAPDSAGIGFRSLVVPNDAADDTLIEDTDFALTNWGAAPGIDVSAGSTCRRGNFRIIAGAGATQVYTWVLTFPTPFAQVPFAIVMHNDFNTLSDGSQVRVTAVATVNDLTVVGFGDPGAPHPVQGSDYHFTWMVME